MSGQHMRIVVTRGDRFDVAEWAPGEPTWIGSGGVYQPSSGAGLFAIVASILAIVGTVLLVRSQRPTARQPLVPTVADLVAVHAGVATRGVSVRRAERLAVGDAVETDADGRARLRLDDGTALVIDRSTKLAVKEAGVAIASGRVFVQGAPGARATIEVGDAAAIVSGADIGISRTGSDAKIYVARAEITVRVGGAETTVRAGDTATIAGGKVTVAPERGYDDWTGGMAAPWTVNGPPRRAVGELWGRASGDDAGVPLTLRAQDVRAVIVRELAETETRATFFNGGSEKVVGDFRMAVPEGAIVSRFAVARRSNVAEGRVALAARNAAVARTSSEVLEWAGEGWVRGTIPSIAPGEAVTVIVAYSEWLSPRRRGVGDNLVVTYRYPLVGDGVPPLVGEFSARVDASASSPASIASGLGARSNGHVVELRRPDFRPTADLVVDVEIEPWAGGADAPPRPLARLYAATASGDDDSGTVLVRTEVPTTGTPGAAGVTLALVMDTSASVEPALLDAERALVAAVIRGLGRSSSAPIKARGSSGRTPSAPSTRRARRRSPTRSPRSRPAAPRISAAPSRPAPTRCRPTRPRAW